MLDKFTLAMANNWELVLPSIRSLSTEACMCVCTLPPSENVFNYKLGSSSSHPDELLSSAQLQRDSYISLF